MADLIAAWAVDTALEYVVLTSAMCLVLGTTASWLLSSELFPWSWKSWAYFVFGLFAFMLVVGFGHG